MNTYDRDSVEFCAVDVTVNGVTPDPGDIDLQVTAFPDRPDDLEWAAPTELDGQIGVMVSGRDPGSYTVWVRVAASPETVVVGAGSFRVT